MLLRSLSVVFCLGSAFAATASFPALTYSTYLRESFTPAAIATDAAGNIYMAGTTIVNSSTTVLVVKLNPQATQYLYARYVGGSVNDYGNAIAVDSAGDAYVAGYTNSPDFPVTSGSNFVTPAAGPIIERSFVFKLDPNGQLVYSALLGGSTDSFAQAIAVNGSGEALVSGTSNTSGFPSTPGVYSVADTAGNPYLLELNATGTAIVFSATGIGGTALTFDSSGNIYMAGTTGSLTYPTTPGTYQASFPVFQTCIAPCNGSFQGPNQYVTKLDPTGSKMIFSTAVSGTGDTINNGLAVDADGNVYLTGLAGVGYPFTVAVPTPPLGPALDELATPSLPFLSKLDPAGQKLLFSVPVGGAGVQVDSSGSAYVGGIVGLFDLYDMVASIPALASVPAPCLAPASQGVTKSAYVSQVDATSGNVSGTQFIGGSSLGIAAVALSGTTLWIAGSTNSANVPFSPNALIGANSSPLPMPGAYLGAIDFSESQPPAGTPQIGCIVDAGELQPAGPIAPNQLLTIFGSGLGPAMPATATNNSTSTLGGVSVSFGSLQAPLLYVSSNQINLAVPLISPGGPAGAMVQVTVNSVSSAQLQFPTTYANPTIFAVPGSFQNSSGYQDFFAVALNADGSLNSATNPAQPGSVISVFVDGLALDPAVPEALPQLSTGNGWSITNVLPAGPFVIQVNLQVPTANFVCSFSNTNACEAGFAVSEDTSDLPGLQPDTQGILSFSGLVYVAQ